MTDEQRLRKLQEAQRLLREVEFSYPPGDETRQMLYNVMVNCFSMNQIGDLITKLKHKTMFRHG